MRQVQVSTRIDENIKEAAQEVFALEGLDIPTVFRMVLTKAANERIVPVDFKRHTKREILEQQLSKLIEPRLKNAEHLDLSNPDELEGWDEW